MDRVTELKQEIFAEVYAKAAAQGFKPSFMDDGEETCAYRGQGEYLGCRCNVGFLIPDDRYDPKIEGNDLGRAGIFELTTAYEKAVARGFDTEDRQEIAFFLVSLQHAHDMAGMDPNFAAGHKGRLEYVAVEENLKIPEIANA